MILKFIKLANIWFYWWPDYEGNPAELAMVEGANDLLDSIGTDIVTVKVVTEIEDPIDIWLKIMHRDSEGATYECVTNYKYDGPVWICPVTLQVFGEYPETICLKVL